MPENTLADFNEIPNVLRSIQENCKLKFPLLDETSKVILQISDKLNTGKEFAEKMKASLTGALKEELAKSGRPTSEVKEILEKIFDLSDPSPLARIIKSPNDLNYFQNALNIFFEINIIREELALKLNKQVTEIGIIKTKTEVGVEGVKKYEKEIKQDGDQKNKAEERSDYFKQILNGACGASESQLRFIGPQTGDSGKSNFLIFLEGVDSAADLIKPRYEEYLLETKVRLQAQELVNKLQGKSKE